MKKISLLFVLVLFSFVEVQGQNFPEMDSLAQSFIEKYTIKGIGFVAVQNGNITHISANGEINPSSTFTDSSRIYIASNTKAFTGLAIAKLASQNKISYTDPVSSYIPSSFFSDSISINKVNVENLLTHTHGLSNDPLIFRTAYSGAYPSDLKELLKFTVYSQDTLSYDFKYSNFGYILSGLIIENLSGQKWQDYINKNILEVAGMTNSGMNMDFDPTLELLPYDFDLPEPLWKSRKSNNTLHAAGGLYSTLRDMGKWLAIFTNENQATFDSALIKNYLFSHNVSVDKRDGPIYSKSYGNGWYYGDLLTSKDLFFHFGRFKGYESVMSFDPELSSGVFVIVNERIGGIYVAALLSSYFYESLQTTSVEMEKWAPIFGLIEKVYSSPVERLDNIFSFKDSDLLTGIYRSDKYGDLLVDKTPDGYSFQLGKMESLGYTGSQENEILVEWTPGIQEHLFILNQNGQVILKYGNFGEFLKI